MKKIVISSIALVLMCATGARAMSVSNPLYMPGEGGVMFDTELKFSNTTSGASYKVYTINERISYNLTERFQVGGFLGYSKIDKLDDRDFTNPGAFAFFRILDNVVKLDIGGEMEFDLFDDRTEGGVADGVNKYAFSVRGGAELSALSLGLQGDISYWDGKGSREYTRNGVKDMVNSEVKAFIIFDIMDIVGIGGEAGYKTFDMRRDADYEGYYLTGRIDINPLPSRLGIVGYITFEDLKNTHDTFSVGAKIRLVL